MRQLTLLDDGGAFAGDPVREDALPENIRYRDEGCELAPSCLNCPLPLCRYDQPGGLRRLRTRGRDAEIVRLRRRERLPIAALACRFRVSRRTVFRILSRDSHESGVQGAAPPVGESEGCPLRLGQEAAASPHRGRDTTWPHR